MSDTMNVPGGPKYIFGKRNTAWSPQAQPANPTTRPSGNPASDFQPTTPSDDAYIDNTFRAMEEFIVGFNRNGKDTDKENIFEQHLDTLNRSLYEPWTEEEKKMGDFFNNYSYKYSIAKTPEDRRTLSLQATIAFTQSLREEPSEKVEALLAVSKSAYEDA